MKWPWVKRSTLEATQKQLDQTFADLMATRRAFASSTSRQQEIAGANAVLQRSVARHAAQSRASSDRCVALVEDKVRLGGRLGKAAVALRAIRDMRTPRSANIGKRMAKVAEDAIRDLA